MPAVIYTAAQCEIRALRKLESLGYRAFLPLCRTKRKPEPRPLFPRYLFAWLDDKPWRHLEASGFITRVLTDGDEPAKVADSEVNVIMDRQAIEGGSALLEDPDEPIKRQYRPGQAIKIVGGSYIGFDGLYVTRASDRIVALLKLFNGREVHASVNERYVA